MRSDRHIGARRQSDVEQLPPVPEAPGEPLRVHGISNGAEADTRVREILEVVGLPPDAANRYPHEFSGGQRQRVAMGRAIVREPKVFLFDEPLSNLDAKLRVQMRLEIQKLHRRLKTTSLYVTHDQIEAMTLAERMIVMNQGMPEQIGTPAEVFEKPASVFVATFIGSPPMNLLPVQVDEQGQIKQDNGQPVQFGPEMVPAAVRGRKVFLGIRPEHIKLHVPGVTTQVEMVEILGSEQLLHLGCGDYRIIVRCPNDFRGAGTGPVDARGTAGRPLLAANLKLGDALQKVIVSTGYAKEFNA